MKMLLFVCLIGCLQKATAQEDQSYVNLLNSTAEIQLTDSLYIKAEERQLNPLDTVDVKKWFSPVTGMANNNRLKNRGYYLAGKITSNNNFDLLVLIENKKKADSANVKVAYIVSFHKDGKYIAFLEVAVSGNRKKSNYNTSSWLYKDFKIMRDSKITVNEKSLNDLAIYKINGTGRFILYPNY